MAIREVVEVVAVEKKRTAKFSDFSGLEMPRDGWHWSAVTRVEIQFKDGAGNGAVRSFDGTPEEIADLKARIDEVLSAIKTKYRGRVIKP